MREDFAPSVSSGSLILVNAAHAYREPAGGEPLAPVHAGESVRLARGAAAALGGLMREIQGWRQILAVSGWRSRQEQQAIWDQSLRDSGETFTRQYVARPGHSEHQTGLAVDLGLRGAEPDFIRPHFPYSGICRTFREQAARYGFVERYPAGKETVTGISPEPWHFRYVGTPHAAILTELGLTLEEYHVFLRRFPYGGPPFRFTACGCRAEIFYCPAELGPRALQRTGGVRRAASGDNDGGFIVTEWRGEPE